MNVSHDQLSRPPIVETGLNVTLAAPPLEEGAVGQLVAQVDSDFAQFAVVEDRAKRWLGTRYRKDGTRFLSLLNAPDRKAVMFSYSIVPPYMSWEKFMEPAKELLSRVGHLLHAAQILAIGVRTIDKLVLPSDRRIAVGDVLKSTLPNVEGMPQPGIMEFYLRDTSFYREYNLCVRTIRSTQPTGEGRPPDIILDTDVFSGEPFEIDDSRKLESVLERIHEVRYKVFKGTVSDAYLEECR